MASSRPVHLWQTSSVVDSHSKAFTRNGRWIWSYIPWLGLACSSVEPHQPRASRYFRAFNIIAGPAVVTYLFRYVTGRASLHHERIVYVLKRYHSSECDIRIHGDEIVIFYRRAVIHIHTTSNKISVLCPLIAKLTSFLFISGVLAMAP